MGQGQFKVSEDIVKKITGYTMDNIVMVGYTDLIVLGKGLMIRLSKIQTTNEVNEQV